MENKVVLMLSRYRLNSARDYVLLVSAVVIIAS